MATALYALKPDGGKTAVLVARYISGTCQAAAGFCISAAKMLPDDDGLGTAVALTNPLRPAVGVVVSTTNRSEFSETKPSHIYDCHNATVTRWAVQVGARAQRLSKQIKDG